MNNEEIRLRAAPSPTGRAHIGNVRTYFMSYAYAKKHGGKFIFRIEDTDQKRSVPGGGEALIEAYSAYGVVSDEDPYKGGPYGPYIQTERKDIYKKYAEELVEKGFAYYCFCSSDRLDQLRKTQKENKEKPMYDGACRSIDIDEAKKRIEAGESYVVRMKFPKEGITECTDLIYGKVKFNNKDIEDQVLLKANGIPTYHLAVVVDDHLMKISTAARGTEWFPSFPKHVKLYEYFGWELPEFVHVPVILNPDGDGKLSKRHGAMPAIAYLRKGYLRDAVLNYTMLCGWAPKPEEAHKDEIYTFDELINLFDFRRCHKVGGRYDQKKFDYINAKHIRNLSLDQLYDTVIDWAENIVLKPFLTDQFDEPQPWEDELKAKVAKLLPLWKADINFFKQILALYQERLVYLGELPDLVSFFYEDDLDHKKEELEEFGEGDRSIILSDLWDKINVMFDEKWSHEKWEATIREQADSLGWKHGQLFMLLRSAITGRKASPPLFECMELLGKEKCDRFINQAIKTLKS